MKHQSEAKTLDPGREGFIYLTVNCAYGQSSYTVVSWLSRGEITKQITSFQGNVVNLKLGSAADFMDKEFRVFSMVKDVIDKSDGRPDMDIQHTILVSGNSDKAGKTWEEGTQGVGSEFGFSLDVQVI